MSISALKKVTLFGTTRDKTEALEELQRLGCMQLVPFSEAPEPETEQINSASTRSRRAVRYLIDAQLKRHQTEDREGFNIFQVTKKALDNKRRKRKVQDEIDALMARIRQVEPWGDFELPPKGYLYDHRFWFYIVPLYQLRKMSTGDTPWRIVYKDNCTAYVVLISKTLPPAETVPVSRSRLGKRSLSTLRRELDRAKTEMEDIEAERSSLTRWISLMIHHLAEADDHTALEQASRESLDDEPIFAVQGWVPESELERLLHDAESKGLACTCTEPGPDEEAPVLFRNPPAFEPGEDLVAFYKIPGYHDWDPSPVVYVSFALFFAMILADAAYGAAIGVLTLLLWKKMAKTASSRRTRKLLAAVSATSVAVGAFFGSYFGVTAPPESFAGKLHFLDINDFDSMMKLSIAIGALHLVIANGVTAWGRRGRWSAVVPVGWMATIIGGFVAYMGVEEALAVVGAGLFLVFLFSSERPVRKVTDILMRALEGAVAIFTKVPSAFGDVLSYLRLFALGLASAMLAGTFNQLGTDVMGVGHGIALLGGLLVLIVGHALNLVLGVVSGVVHGLRLNVIELFNWSVFGESGLFRPFRKKVSMLTEAEEE